MVQNASTAGRTDSEAVRWSTRYDPATRRMIRIATPATISPMLIARTSLRLRPGTSQSATAHASRPGSRSSWRRPSAPASGSGPCRARPTLRMVIRPASGGRVSETLPRNPKRSPSWTTSGWRSRTTFPPVVSSRVVSPSSTLTTCACASDDAFTKRFWTRGRASSSRAALSIASRESPAIGAASGCRLSAVAPAGVPRRRRSRRAGRPSSPRPGRGWRRSRSAPATSRGKCPRRAPRA